jgi:hypothetical protein
MIKLLAIALSEAGRKLWGGEMVGAIKPLYNVRLLGIGIMNPLIQ